MINREAEDVLLLEFVPSEFYPYDPIVQFATEKTIDSGENTFGFLTKLSGRISLIIDVINRESRNCTFNIIISDDEGNEVLNEQFLARGGYAGERSYYNFTIEAFKNYNVRIILLTPAAQSGNITYSLFASATIKYRANKYLFEIGG